MNLTEPEVQNLGINAAEVAEILAPALNTRPDPVDLLDAIHNDDGIRAIEMTTPTAEALHAQADVREFIASHIPTATPVNETVFETEAMNPEQINAVQMGRVIEPETNLPPGMERYVVSFDNASVDEQRGQIKKLGKQIAQYEHEPPRIPDDEIDDIPEGDLRNLYINMVRYFNMITSPLPEVPTHTAKTVTEARQEKGVGSGLYVPLGRHKINHHKLREGILQMKYPGGSGIRQIPTQKISRSLQELVTQLKDGKTPSIRAFEALSPADKDLLYTLVHHAKIELDVPTPETDRDLERFEIVKGEICAGNDNPQLVKELKSLLIRFGKNGRIPKRQVNELLETLLDFNL